MKKSALYICYYNIHEPLVQSQVLAYVRELARRGIKMHLLTFERERFSAESLITLRDELAAEGIHWHSLRYHQRPSLPATFYDITVGIVTAMRICLRNDIQLIHARGQVPGAMALALQRLLRSRFLYDLRGLLAEEYADGGNWKLGDLKFRLTKGMERLFLSKADGFVMLTQRIKDELTATGAALEGRSAEIKIIPCCVDTNRFAISPEERAAYRQSREWASRRVLVYAGKLGLWYLPDEMARFFSVARQNDPRLFFQVLTQDDPALMRRALEKYDVQTTDYDIRFAPPHQVPLILSAADTAISFIRACPSKRASSPTKIGEYLAAGLPVVTNAGIGDCDRMLGDHRLGLILSDFSDSDFRRAADELGELLADDGIARRCREFAQHELSLAEVGGPRYAAAYERLFGALGLETYVSASSKTSGIA